MATAPRFDRAYLGMLDDNELVEYVRNNCGNSSDNLSQVLVERLVAVTKGVIQEYKEEIDDLREALSDAENERDEAREEVERLETKIAQDYSQ